MQLERAAHTHERRAAAAYRASGASIELLGEGDDGVLAGATFTAAAAMIVLGFIEKPKKEAENR